ncbi:hypothetical protein sr14514 [Sporisorium reilianum SRZ2]|uniref:Uncharacterized protein n=1 Tax=Sporisorium reilianum (strain SRZ2) TaxID=999809 RepID=E7A303_SPORE|nr:hypothetical protein sr14514 [Sporisorium reilianum SRZ2]
MTHVVFLSFVAKGTLLGQRDTVKAGLDVTLHKSIRPASQRAQTAIIEQVTKYPAAVLRTGHDEARQKVVTGGLCIGIVRQAFAVIGSLGGTGRISALTYGLDSRVNASACLPGPHQPSTEPSSDRSIASSVGIKLRAAHGYAPNINANQVVFAQPAYPKSSQVEMTNFVHILEANGFLTSSKRHKHILTPAELNVVLADGTHRPHHPGLCSDLARGEWFASWRAVPVQQGQRRQVAGATLLALSVGRCPALPQRSRLARQEGRQRQRHQQRWQQQQGGGAVLFAPYPVEVWQELHSRRDHPFLAEPSDHRNLALGMWINVFEPGSDKALREIIFDSSNTALRPGSRLEIRKEWRSVPVLLCDRSIFTDDKHKHKTVHEMRLVAMPHSGAASCLSSIASIPWDGLTFYDYRRTFAALVKHQIPDEQLKLLMGHRRSRSWVADSVYLLCCRRDRTSISLPNPCRSVPCSLRRYRKGPRRAEGKTDLPVVCRSGSGVYLSLAQNSLPSSSTGTLHGHGQSAAHQGLCSCQHKRRVGERASGRVGPMRHGPGPHILLHPPPLFTRR